MLATAAQAINQFYRKKDYEAFKALCATPLELPKELKEYIQNKGLQLIEEEDNKAYPSKTWAIKFDYYKNGEFEVAHTTKLQISKVVPLFFIRHEFVIPSKDPDTLDPELKGWGGEANFQQFDLNAEIIRVLSEKGFHEMIYGGMIEAVEGFKIPEGKEALGRNVTVEHLLFMDIFDLLLK